MWVCNHSQRVYTYELKNLFIFLYKLLQFHAKQNIIEKPSSIFEASSFNLMGVNSTKDLAYVCKIYCF